MHLFDLVRKSGMMCLILLIRGQTRAESILSNVDFYYQEKAAMLFRNSAESFSGEEGPLPGR